MDESAVPTNIEEGTARESEEEGSTSGTAAESTVVSTLGIQEEEQEDGESKQGPESNPPT